MKETKTTNQLVRQLENRIPPPIVAFAIALGMWAITKTFSAWPLATSVRVGLAMIIALPAPIIAGLAVRAFRKANTMVNPNRPTAASTMVTDGVFRYTRNPMYVGLTALLLAWAIFLSVPWGLAGSLAFVLFTTRFQIIPEERSLLSKFGAVYSDYRAKVRRWL